MSETNVCLATFAFDLGQQLFFFFSGSSSSCVPVSKRKPKPCSLKASFRCAGTLVRKPSSSACSYNSSISKNGLGLLLTLSSSMIFVFPKVYCRILSIFDTPLGSAVIQERCQRFRTSCHVQMYLHDRRRREWRYSFTDIISSNRILIFSRLFCE